MIFLDVWQGIADTLNAGLVGVNITPFEPSTPQAPALFPLLPEQGAFHRYQGPGGGGVDVTVTVRLLVAAITDGGTLEAVLPYFDTEGGSSILAALEADPTLGGTVGDSNVTGWESLGPVVYGQVDYLGVDFSLQLLG